MSPARKLPVDFEKKVKQAPPVDGNGYPYKLSAKDLMENYKYLLNMLPDADAGDMVYCDGSAWVKLQAPSPASDSAMVLSHTGTEPEWIDQSLTTGIDLNVYIQQGVISPDTETSYILEYFKTIFVRDGKIMATSGDTYDTKQTFSTDLGETEMPVGTIEVNVTDMQMAV